MALKVILEGKIPPPDAVFMGTCQNCHTQVKVDDDSVWRTVRGRSVECPVCACSILVSYQAGMTMED